MNNEINKDWLKSSFPQDHCPYCGEDYDIDFDREDDGLDTSYWATCGRCGRSWGQRYTLVFQFNFEDT